MPADGLLITGACTSLGILGVLFGHLRVTKPERVRPQLHSQVRGHDPDRTPYHSLHKSSACQQFLIGVGPALMARLVKKNR
jgi:hypothetical protein